MAMGAFMAGVLLSESSYRQQLEVDVEPFRGVLLGLFFIAVGMSLQLDVVAANWGRILGYGLAFMLVKAATIYAVARLFRSSHATAVERAIFMAQGGEFAFVLYGAAAAAGIIDAEQNANLTAIVILSMVATPLVIAVFGLLHRRYPRAVGRRDGPQDLHGVALVIGFGRMGQIACQFLFARGYDVSIIDTDVEMIDAARNLGFEVYYGDGTRLDILHAAGAGRARVVLVCVDSAGSGTRITELLKSEFPGVPVLGRAIDRRHSVELLKAGVDLQVRETFESAMVLGAAALERLGASQAEIADLEARIRANDKERLDAEMERGLAAGAAFFNRRAVRSGNDLP